MNSAIFLWITCCVYLTWPIMSQEVNNENQIKVFKKLNELFTDDEDFTRLTMFLVGSGNTNIYMNTLSALVDNDQRFRIMSECYLQKSRTVATDNINDDGYHHSTTDDENFEKLLELLPIVTIPDGQVDYLNNYLGSGLRFTNLVQGIRKIPAERQAVIISEIMNVVNSMFGKNSLTTVKISEFLTQAQMAVNVRPKYIVTVQLSWNALKSIRSWWKEEITGERCAKQIIDASAGILGGYAGGAVGSTIGTTVFPGFGTLAGGVIGGFAGFSITTTFSEWLTEYFFNLPKSAALENAYKFLQLCSSCSNDEINESYRTLALKYHPDKGGNAENFHTLQISVAIIKQARGQGV